MLPAFHVGQVVPYTEINLLRLAAVDSNSRGQYMSTKWIIYIGSKSAKIGISFSDTRGSENSFAFEKVCALTSYHIVPFLCSRVVNHLQTRATDITFGPFKFNRQTMSYYRMGLFKKSLTSTDFQRSLAHKSRLLIMDNKGKVWWRGSIKRNMIFAVPDVLNACQRLLVSGQTKPVFGGQEPSTAPAPQIEAALARLKERPAYQHDNKMEVFRFVLACALGLVSSAFGGILIAAVYLLGLYLVSMLSFNSVEVKAFADFLAPTFGAALGAQGMRAALFWARNRNRWAAIILGGVCGIDAFLSQAYFIIFYWSSANIPPPNQWWFFLLNNPHDPYFVYYASLGIVMSTGVFAYLAYETSQSAFCTISNTWMIRERFTTQSGNSRALVLAFGLLDPRPLEALLFKRTASETEPRTVVNIEYSSKFSGSEPAQLFVSVGESRGQTFFLRPTERGFSRALFTRSELDSVMREFSHSSGSTKGSLLNLVSALMPSHSRSGRARRG